MRSFVDSAFSSFLEDDKLKTKNNLPFSNRFELVRVDQYHRKNIKEGNQIKKLMRGFNKETT
jgi:hypothetical protein